MPEPRRIVRVRKTRRLITNIKAGQAHAQLRQPDLGGTGRLLRFGAQQREVIRRETTPVQRRTLKGKKFSSTILPLERAPRQLVPDGVIIVAAAIGGAKNTPTRAQGRPKTILSLNTFRGASNVSLRRTARHEVAHQLTASSAIVQHKQFKRVGGTAGNLAAGRRFFRRFENLNSKKPRRVVRVGN